ncbi:MAG: type I-U CRISPR-associated protein Cas5/Cas6 [Thermoplasmata archaeon]|nr:MAG: type I-U CRISPR-associated protein Cas5/Cas6 [Thermoplasmata archaeon]
MIAVRIRFTAGRYHATIWGKHVNEAIPEWPPSPWRLLRALIATWKRKTTWVEEKKVREIISKLLEPPYFKLPRASVGHSRHYMPWSKQWAKQRDQSRTMVIDTFVVVNPEDYLEIYWPNQILSEDQQNILEELLKRLSYLGRTESWCEASLIKERRDLIVKDSGLVDEATGEVVAPVRPYTGKLSEDEELVEVLVPSREIDPKAPLNEEHPLLVRTGILREKEGRIDPPGSKWVLYVRNKECFTPQLKSEPLTTDIKPIKVVRYKFHSTVPPRITETLELAYLARIAAMGIYGGKEKRRSPILSGKGEDGKPLKGHTHAFYFITDEDRDGKADHLTIYSPNGFDMEHQKALLQMKKLYPRKEGADIYLLLLGMAEDPDELKRCPIFMESMVWYSSTPYLLTRHPKLARDGSWKVKDLPEGIQILIPEKITPHPSKEHLLTHYGILPDMSKIQVDGPLDQILLEMERRGLPKPEKITLYPSWFLGNRPHRWLEFRRYRRGRPDPPIGIPYGFKLHFSEPIKGPIALGHACHYGMGLFLPEL